MIKSAGTLGIIPFKIIILAEKLYNMDNAIYHILRGSHSGLRWIALLLLLVAIFNAVASLKSGHYRKKDKMLNLFAMVVLHIQFVIGACLMLTSPKVSYGEEWMKSEVLRFFGLEHLLAMLIAIVLITIGRRKAENTVAINAKHRKIVIFYSIGLVIILAMIPWPVREALGGKWM